LITIEYVCPICGKKLGQTASFSHDHQFTEPEVVVEERVCSECGGKTTK